MLFHHCPGGKLWLLPFINFCSVTIVLLLCEIIFFFTPQVPKVTHTEFCQGRTMRWALAWSFYDDMMAPVSLCILFCCHGLPWPTILPVFFLNGSCLHISKNPEATSELCTSSAAPHLSPGCNPLSSSHVPLEALIFCSGDTFIWFSVFFFNPCCIQATLARAGPTTFSAQPFCSGLQEGRGAISVTDVFKTE